MDIWGVLEDEFDEIKKMKITSNDVIKVLKKIFIILCKIFGVLGLIALVFGSGGAVIVVMIVIQLVRQSRKR